MDKETGKIYAGDEVKLLTPEIQKRLMSFEINEVVEIKGCYFKIIYIRTDRSSITLQGIPGPA